MRLGVRGRGRRVFLLGGAVVALLLLSLAAAYGATDSSYLPRVFLWRDADIGDHARFPARVVENDSPVFEYSRPPSGAVPDSRLETVTVERNGVREVRQLEDYLASSGTTAFHVIYGDRLIQEGYYNGHDRESTQTSFSVAKSFVSALVGIAIQEEHIRSVDDPITLYLPELLARDPRFAKVTIRHLLTMSSGIHYDEGGLPWVDDGTRTYYAPNLRKLALEGSRIESEPGKRFEYNNYHPLLLGLILERTTGKSVAQYLEDKLWRPLGMEADGSWSLDSTASGFEKMESGINGRAIDFAKFGSLYLRKGEWRGSQLVPSRWHEESTRSQVDTARSVGYGYFWWIGKDGHYSARGNHGQFIFEQLASRFAAAGAQAAPDPGPRLPR